MGPLVEQPTQNNRPPQTLQEKPGTSFGSQQTRESNGSYGGGSYKQY